MIDQWITQIPASFILYNVYIMHVYACGLYYVWADSMRGHGKYVDQMLVQVRAYVADGGPALKQHWVNPGRHVKPCIKDQNIS